MFRYKEIDIPMDLERIAPGLNKERGCLVFAFVAGVRSHSFVLRGNLGLNVVAEGWWR
jgi:hypothetical protein